MFTTIRIKKHERGLWFRHGDFKQLLQPGTYRLWGAPLLNLKRDTIEAVNTLKTKFEHPLLDVLVTDPTLREELHVIDLTDSERALVWKDERLAHIVGP